MKVNRKMVGKGSEEEKEGLGQAHKLDGTEGENTRKRWKILAVFFLCSNVRKER